jgi:hypothetical protein
MLAPRAKRQTKNFLEGGYLLLLYAISLPYWGFKTIQARSRKSNAFPFRLNYLGAVPYIVLFVVAAAPAFYLGWGHAGAFNTPDETAASLAARTFAEDGRLYLEDNLSESHQGRLGGPRGFIEHNGRAVPFYPLGHPLVLGVAEKAFGEATPLVLAIIPALLILSLALLLRILIPGSSPYLGFTFLGVAPLWYWTSRVYMDLALTFLFIGIGLLCFVLAVRRISLAWLFGGSCAFGLAALARLSEAPLLLLVGMAFIIALIHRSAPFRPVYLVQVLAVYALAQVVFFLVPLALLNWWTYGSPTDIGYMLFYQQFHPDLVPQNGNPVLAAADFMQAAFFPNPMSLDVLKSGIIYQIILLVPMILALAMGGLWLSRRTLLNTFGYTGVLLLAVTMAYVLAGRTNPDTHGAQVEVPFILASLVRYWMPVYLALGIGAAYGLSHASRAVSVAVVCGLVAVSTFQVWVSNPEAVLRLRDVVNGRALHYEQVLQANTEAEAIVFAVGRIDKFVAPFRRTVGVWENDPSPQDIRGLAESAISMHELGKPVYFVFDLSNPRHGNNVQLLNVWLNEHLLQLRRLDPTDRDIGLWRMEGVAPPLVMKQVGQGVYKALTPAPRKDFAVSIENDGSPVNQIINPSFESGLDGWSGPGLEDLVRPSRDEAYLGRNSLRLALPPLANQGYLVRRTETIKIDLLDGTDWVAMARLKAAQLSSARAEMRIFLHDASGKTVERETVAVTEASKGFVTLGLRGNISHREATSISLQLNIRALERGGSGVVYWDGVELKSGTFAPQEGCEGVTTWCSWIDDSHQTRAWDEGIELITVKTETGSEVDLRGPFQVNDQLVFREDGIYLDRMEGSSETRLANFPRPHPDSQLELVVTAMEAPSMRVVLNN